MVTESRQPSKYLRLAFFLLVRVLVLVLLGINARRRELLPTEGPAIIVANHNSHLDTLLLISLFPLRLLPRIRPVAAAEYFLTNALLAWFALRVIGIIPIRRGAAGPTYDPLQSSGEALSRGSIVVLFPEGTRGEPEQIADFKKGIAHLAERFPQVPVIPVFIHGLGKALPKGDFVLVPFFCDVFIGPALSFHESRHAFMNTLNERFQQLTGEEHRPVWE